MTRKPTPIEHAAASREGWYTLAEVAEHFGVSDRTVRRWVQHGLIATVRVAGRSYITTEGIERFVADGGSSLNYLRTSKPKRKRKSTAA